MEAYRGSLWGLKRYGSRATGASRLSPLRRAYDAKRELRMAAICHTGD